MKANAPQRPRAISLFENWRTIRQLEKLRDLIRHDNGRAHQINLARPLKKLGINEKDPNRHQEIRSKINSLIPIAQRSAAQAQVSTGIIVTEKKVGISPIEYEDIHYDLFIHYHTLMSEDYRSTIRFDMTIDVLDQVIGYYKEVRYRRLINLLNPLRIVASILRIPISVLEYMGFDARGTAANTVLSIIIRFIWILFLAILVVYFSEKSELIKTLIDLLKSGYK